MPNHLPTGAQALLLALATPSPQGQTGIPVLLWGRPGVGKSSFIEGLVTEKLPVTTLIASIHDPTDFSGLPVLEEGRVRYAAPSWVDSFSEAGEGILFLDELSTAPPSVQSALLRVVFERKVGFHPLPEGVRIVAAANPPDMMVGGWELSPPLRNRFVHLNWDVGTDLYVHALTNGWALGELPSVEAGEHAARVEDVRLRFAGFFRVRPDALHANPEENRYGFASPRTWDFAAALLATGELLGYRFGTEDDGRQTVLFELLAGCLGEPTAITLVEYLRNLRLPDPGAVLAGEVAVDVSELNDAELYVLFASLNNRMEKAFDSERIGAYSATYLGLARATFADGRRDTIFVALKELARKGWLLRVAGRPELMTAVQEVFADERLNEFIDVLA